MSGQGRHAGKLIGFVVLIAFVLGHELEFVVTYGSDVGAGLARTGHGSVWWATVATVLCLAGGLGMLALRRLGELSRLSDAIEAGHVEVREASRWHLARRVLGMWPAILVASLTLFLITENVEHVLAGMPAPGQDALGSGEYPATPFVFLVVSLAAACVAGLYRWRCDVLAARIAAVSAAARRRPHHARQATPQSQIPASAPARHSAARAPPWPAAR